MKKAIVTGAAGFTGLNLVEALLAAGYFVYAVVRPGSAHNKRIPTGPQLSMVEADLGDLATLPEKIAEKCDVFFHLAWQGDRDDFAVQYGNVDASLIALEAAAQLGCRRFICTGSQAEYGLQQGAVTEETLPMPVNAYGAAKLAACYLTKRRAEQLGVEWIWGRIFSIYGKYEPATTLVSYLVASLRRGESPKLTAATQNWDYLYSEDAADALLALAAAGQSGEIYNIANGNYRPLREFTEEVRAHFAPQVAIHYGEEARQIVSLQPVVEKIHRDTGWQAKTLFMEGLLKAVAMA